ncbi:class I glutamine amidotransferase-like protein [Phycomyces nitens]|nr:class I glutamine amidotransferase-like protein [Phycomyces nitens]
MTKSAIVFLANGTEDMEFTITADILRRAKIDVTVVGVELEKDKPAICANGTKILPDVLLTDKELEGVLSFDAVVVPGGLKGSHTCRDNSKVQAIVKSLYDQKKIVAFICAATIVAKSSGIPQTHTVTSNPVVMDQLSSTYNYSHERVVVDQNVITSRGPGTAFLFALTIVENLVGKETADQLKANMLTSSVL